MERHDDADIREIIQSSEPVFDGIILHIEHVHAKLPNGHMGVREVARHIGASAVLPVDQDGNCFLVRQFRAAIDRVTLEIPAGKLDFKGEDRLLAAQRELREETGLTAGKWTHLTDMHSSVGFTDERLSLYLAQDLTRGESAPDEDEFLNLVRIPLKDLVAMCERGELTDSKTLVTALLAARLLGI